MLKNKQKQKQNKQTNTINMINVIFTKLNDNTLIHK